MTADDGRFLQVLERGSSDGRPVLVHHGSPGSRLLLERDVERAHRMGIRLIAYDRPGYGSSTRSEGRSVADCAADVRAIAGSLGIERLAVWGISGGGPHAIACAALLGDLVVAVGVLASPAPWGAEGLDYFAGMGELNATDMRRMIDNPTAARAKCEDDRQELLVARPEEALEQIRTLLSAVDAAALTGDVVEHMLASARLGLADSSDGWWDDETAFMSSWGFELDSISTPVLLLHGRQDRFVPFGQGEWLARHIPGVEAWLTEDDGHVTLTERHLDEVHAWLLERLG